MRLAEFFLKLKRQSNSITYNPLLDAFDLENIKMFEDIEASVEKEGKILLKSLNPNYTPYSVNNEDVLEIWKYYKHQTGTLPEEKTDLQELKTLILDLRAHYRK